MYQYDNETLLIYHINIIIYTILFEIQIVSWLYIPRQYIMKK